VGTLSQSTQNLETVPFDWGITDSRIRETVARIVQYAKPLRIIAFGSWARGEVHPQSDLDLAVILDDGPEAMNLRPSYSLLEGIRMSVDMIVASRERHEQFQLSPNSIHHAIAKEGVVHYDRNAG
jgi:uncharacterized protein